MTDEAGGANTPDTPDQLGDTPVPAAEGAVPATNNMFSSSEGMVVFGAGVLIAAYVIFDFIWAEYFLGWLVTLLAVIAVVLPRANRGFVEKIAPLPVLMKAAGYSIAILGVLAITSDIRFATSALDDVPEILGALVSYAGFAIVFLGARSIEVD